MIRRDGGLGTPILAVRPPDGAHIAMGGQDGNRAQVTVRNDDSESARAVAYVEPGMIANVTRCDGRWCQISIESFRGYVQQKLLWGIYLNEIVK